ncbi:MAG: hypothetical protein OEY99_08135 [Aigarchaeota archaeon]|nr:hypothetical protein [Aigarchaeota archaeon]
MTEAAGLRKQILRLAIATLLLVVAFLWLPLVLQIFTFTRISTILLTLCWIAALIAIIVWFVRVVTREPL